MRCMCLTSFDRLSRLLIGSGLRALSFGAPLLDDRVKGEITPEIGREIPAIPSFPAGGEATDEEDAQEGELKGEEMEWAENTS